MLGLGNSVLSDFKTVFLDDYSLSFNGVDEYVDCDPIAAVVDAELGSISVWIKVDTVASSRIVWSCRVDSNNFIQLYYHAASNELRLSYKGGGSTVQAASDTAIENDGNWHHAVATWSSSANQAIIYMDGTKKETKTGLPTISGDFATSDIGQNTNGGAYWDGKINDFSLYNRVLTDANVTDIYNSGKPKDEVGNYGENLVIYYKFETGSGVYAIDSSVNKLNGTLQNTPTWDTDVP